MSKQTIEQKEMRQFEKNWHIVKKTGGAIYYNEHVIERGKTPFLMLSIVIQKQPGNSTMKALIELTKSNISGREWRQENANVKDIIHGLEYLQHPYLKASQQVPKAKNAILQKAINRFHALNVGAESTLTLRLDPEKAAKLKEAGRRSGLRVATKTLYFVLDYYLLQTDQDEAALTADDDPNREKLESLIEFDSQDDPTGH